MNYTNITWLALIERLMNEGSYQKPRGIGTYELLGVQSIIDMNKPLLTVTERKLSYIFALAEAFWIISGDNSVEGISRFNKNISYFSDNGYSFFGAYGPKIIEQINYIIHILKKDKSSRQAVINIWRENPSYTKDVPCTLSIQFLIRDDYLHCIDTMRSSDVWLGWPYDVFNFSMLSAFVALSLREEYPILKLGKLYLNVGSQHLYEKNYEEAKKVIEKSYFDFNYDPIYLNEFKDQNYFLKHLGMLRTNNDPKLLVNKNCWLHELVEWRYDRSK